MPNWLLNTAIGFFLSFTAFMLAAFFVGERRRAQQGIVSDLQASKAVRRIAAALFTALLATTVAMAAFISLWFLLVPIPCLLLMLPTFSPASRWKSAPAVVEGPVIQRAMWDMSIIGAWMLETQGFEYARWFQSMLSDPTINAALREYASGMEDRFLTRVYNWSRAILVGAYLLKLGEKDFSSWRTRLLATLDQTTLEEIVPLIMELRHAALELQADVGKGRRGDQILSILKNEPAKELFIGRVVGNYRILETIGIGGMGMVFRSLELTTDREVAIKVLRREFVRHGEVVDRFVSEANVLAKLNHPNIAALYSFFQEGDDLFMVMELVPGETLASVVSRHGPLPHRSAVELFCHILEGIGYAHTRGIVHRDIKPSNVILSDCGSVKVMDFGIARVAGTERKTKFGNIIGTPEYMSPEQIQCLEADSRSDIYSLGVLLFEILTGRLPFIGNEYELFQCHLGKEPPSLCAFVDIPAHLEQAVSRALVKNPNFRFQSAGEFRDALLSNSEDSSAGLPTWRFRQATEREVEYLARLSPALQPKEGPEYVAAKVLLAQARSEGLDVEYLKNAALTSLPKGWPRPVLGA